MLSTGQMNDGGRKAPVLSDKGEKMTGTFTRLVTDESGQDLAEYGIALAVIGVIAGAAAVVIASDVGSLWSRAQSVIDSAATAS